MATPEELMLQDLNAKYANISTDQAFTRLYTDQGTFCPMLASFHQRLNGHFDYMNEKAKINRHFNASDSRQLLDLIGEISDAQRALNAAGMNLAICDDYKKLLDACERFLARLGGSSIPEDLPKIEIIRYKPVFTFPDTQVRLTNRRESYPLKMVGQGAFAIVFKYVDPEYGFSVALKRAKRNIEPKELIRFRKEFELMKELRFPHVLQVYRYNDDRNEYTMEYCDSNLHDYMATYNAKLSFATRKRIALQFLYGLNYLHSKGHLHRDVSYRNVLVKQYDGATVMVKLSDFGLYKERDSALTTTESELRGTILDPTIANFKDYNVSNEIYSIGFLLSFIFSGRKHITACSGLVRPIIDKCVAHDQAARYMDVRSIIHDVEQLEPGPGDAKSETPA